MRATAAARLTDLVSAIDFALEYFDGSPQSFIQLTVSLEHLRSYASRRGLVSFEDITPEIARDWVWALTNNGRAAGYATRNLRRWALRYLFALLRGCGFDVGDPTLDLTIGGQRPILVRRPVTDDELDLVHKALMTTHAYRTMYAVAIAEATGLPAEIARIRRLDLRLEDGIVELPGSKRTFAREGLLTPWGLERLSRITDWQADRLVATKTNDDVLAAESNVRSALRNAMRYGRVAGKPGIQNDAIRLWGGRKIYDDFGLRAAANALGLESLDKTAELLGVEQ